MTKQIALKLGLLSGALVLSLLPLWHMPDVLTAYFAVHTE